ncbi:putative Integral membrane protein [Seiridium cardinale]|uniref:Integral membrane protein n=1 Tax=Seiridium cardinale TaxID=138064 RepID=A0ABR2XED7_9PEZI
MAGKGDDWRGMVIWKMPEWVEPVGIVSILLTAMFITRRRNFSIFDRKGASYRPLITQEDSPRTSDDTDYTYPPKPSPECPPKRRRILGLWTVLTPNSSRFSRHFHSRILQKYPFLVEMFYWVITYFFYRMTAYLSAIWYGSTESLWLNAQEHGIALLESEAWALGATSTNTNRWIEWRVQQWFVEGAQAGDIRRLLLTILNRAYALIHIPGTVGFIAYYYYVAPNHTRFSTVRRTMSLLNLFAFFTFTVYPCMPPRLLPKEYGFIDTVNAEDAASVFMSGKYVNKLAAMPSMHFGYAFCIGCVFIYESGFLRQWCRLSSKKADLDEINDIETPEYLKEQPQEGGSDQQRSAIARILFLVVGILYPSFILLCIVATANHYILDAVAAAFVVLLAYTCNRMLLNFLVLEDWLLWAWRLEKPEPTTGKRFS